MCLYVIIRQKKCKFSAVFVRKKCRVYLIIRRKKCKFAVNIRQKKCEIMIRTIYNQLVEWKNKPCRKPLIINEARQAVRLIYCMNSAKNEYTKLAYFSLDRDKKACEVFRMGGKTQDILLALSAISTVS